MSAARPLVAVSAAVMSAVVLAASPPSPVPPVADAPGSPKAAEIAELIRQLGSGRYTVREKAQQALWQAGAAAEPALRAALTNTDPEIVRRARELLDKFDWGLYPDTPEPVRTQIERFRGAEGCAARQTIVAALVRLGRPGATALAKFAARPEMPAMLTAEGGAPSVANCALASFNCWVA